MQVRTVGIFLFNEVEVLDVAGPYEVFSLGALPDSDRPLFDVKTVSEDGGTVSARNGLKVTPDYSFDHHPAFDIVIIPGGYGAEAVEIDNPNVIQWIQRQQFKTEIMISVCTGAFLLAKAGILDGKRAATHWMDAARLEKEFPAVSVVRDVKYVDEGSVITSGGISAGINMSFHVLSRLHDKSVAKQTAKRMEYDIKV
ncbi:DJ-1/PfpI family protein [Salibacterium qingdaonense]|uniref:DJ-1/PfpI family protein n=1 Tax=Salibacterium qingdaonense TaxID=266892 RepID=A0A1I4LK87_9BACI|nr:DJ-1/PfpI family protein [Salibacterium qingdaonense]SFL91444.1 DJ-1/PfpI family protein [Salibacterium qingdaonense]